MGSSFFRLCFRPFAGRSKNEPGAHLRVICGAVCLCCDCHGVSNDVLRCVFERPDVEVSGSLFKKALGSHRLDGEKFPWEADHSRCENAHRYLRFDTDVSWVHGCVAPCVDMNRCAMCKTGCFFFF